MSQQCTQPKNLTTLISANNTLAMVERTQQRQKSHSGNLIKKRVEAIAGIASQQQPQTSSALCKPTTRYLLISDDKNEEN